MLATIRQKRILALMLGDTSMGMINGYFGPRLLYKIGFSEHKVDQAWLIDRVKTVSRRARRRRPSGSSRTRGSTFHWQEADAEDFTAEATREQLRGYLAVLDLLDEFKADCLGWQYQLGLLKLLPPSDFAEGLLNSHARPEGNGHAVMTSTEADQGNLVPMELMKRSSRPRACPARSCSTTSAGGPKHDGRFLWVLLNSGSCGAYAFNHDVNSLQGVHSYRQPAGYFPVPGGTFAGVSLAGPITWARAWLDRTGQLVMELGRGESVELARRRPRSLVARHHPPVAVHGRRPRLLDGNHHGPLHEQPHRRRLWRHLRRDGRAQPVARLQGADHVVAARGGLNRPDLAYARTCVTWPRISCGAGSIRCGSAGLINELAMPDRNPGDRLCAGRARC